VRFPVRELIWMSLFLLLVAVVATLLAAPLQRAYLANPFFNTLILSVLVIGILVHVRQILRLWPEIRWLDEYRRGDSRELEPPRRGLMASMAQMLIARQRQRLVLSPSTMRVLLDGIRARLDESRDVARYLIGLLIFLGLLGTFWGLLDTLTSVSAVLGSLEVDSDDAGAMFGALKSGLEEPLRGMGTAFSSSLFGLAGALVLGFCDLQAGHAQNRFFNDLEEWLASVTQVGGPLGMEGEPALPSYIQALLEQAADGLDKLQRSLAQGEDDRRALNNRVMALTAQLAALAEQMQGGQRQVAELPELLQRLCRDVDVLREQNEVLIRHLGNIEVGVTTLLGDINLHGGKALEELRAELRLLAKAIGRQVG